MIDASIVRPRRMASPRTILGAVAAATLLAASALLPSPASAEGIIRIANQFGIGYLPLHIVRDQKLIEKHGREAGVDIEVEWATLSGGSAMNDALLSGSLDIGAGGVAPMLTIWDRTRGEVKAIAALSSLPLVLTTNNPAVNSIKDLTEADRIALPSVKVSIQARTLQMAAEAAFGEGNHERLDNLTVSLPHPDATAALLSGGGGVNAHFTAAPFHQQQLRDPKIRRILSSYDVLGGKSTQNVVWARDAFRQENPRTYAAFLAALREASDFIARDPKASAEIYKRVEGSRLDAGFVSELIVDPEAGFTVVPQNTFKYVAFMHRIGAIKTEAVSWQDYFFEEIHAEPGS